MNQIQTSQIQNNLINQPNNNLIQYNQFIEQLKSQSGNTNAQQLLLLQQNGFNNIPQLNQNIYQQTSSQKNENQKDCNTISTDFKNYNNKNNTNQKMETQISSTNQQNQKQQQLQQQQTKLNDNEQNVENNKNYDNKEAFLQNNNNRDTLTNITDNQFSTKEPQNSKIDDEINSNKDNQNNLKSFATVKPLITQEKIEVHKNLRNQIRKQIQMDHGTEEGCKVLKAKRIDFIVHNKKKGYVFIQFGQTNFDSASEGKMINMLYKRLDLKKSKMEEDLANTSEGDASLSEEDRQIMFSEDSLNSVQQEQSVHAETVFPNFINETCFIFKKKSTPNGLVLDQVLYSDKIIKYIGYDIQQFQLMAVNEGTPTLLNGRESFYSMMKTVQKQANYYLSTKENTIQSDEVDMILKGHKQGLISAKCRIQCQLVEGSFYVKIEVINTIKKNVTNVQENVSKEESLHELTSKKLQRFSPNEQEFLRRYINQTPENELEHNKDKICGFKFVDEIKETEYNKLQEDFNKQLPKSKRNNKKQTQNNSQQQQQQTEQKKQQQTLNQKQEQKNAQKKQNNAENQKQDLTIYQHSVENAQLETKNPLIPSQPNIIISYNQPVANNYDISDESSVEDDESTINRNIQKQQKNTLNNDSQESTGTQQKNDDNENSQNEKNIEEIEQQKKQVEENSSKQINLVSNDYELQQLKRLEQIKQQQFDMLNQQNNQNHQQKLQIQQQQQQITQNPNKQNQNDSTIEKLELPQNEQKSLIQNIQQSNLNPISKNMGIITLPEMNDEDEDEEF